MESRIFTEEIGMNCVVCKSGQTKPGSATVTLNRGESVIVMKGVPAGVCENCGEYYLSDEISARVMESAETAVRRGAEVEILRFAA